MAIKPKRYQPSVFEKAGNGFIMGGAIGGTIGVLFGSAMGLRHGLRGKELATQVGQAAVQSAGAFGFFLAVGSVVRN
eukprot:CAMPEP_0201558858 /NCGR_PEP_ID=MMETSP0173_2-20130828/70488_1 /ASSEMBLY_ACC=CAM_ASM_000268 /TAXON_ID=218659 /ORGANISM="Vexillifera sp., Strain DIVA3 564/2" /LENGTH=76 /DNA_ID=CAMNT_0047972501 /DNA_START=67 /DNA_END=297 /DNA_ORIENTATION=+